MKKRILKCSLLLLLIFTLTGCGKISVNAKVDSKANVSINGSLYVSEVQLNQLNKNIDEFKDLLIGYGLDFLEGDCTPQTKEIDGITCQGFFFFADSTKFLEASATNEEVTVVIHNPEDFIEISIANTNGKTLSEFFKDINVEITSTIMMPGRITSYSDGEKKGNAITIDPLDINGDLAITSRTFGYDVIQAIVLTLGTGTAVAMNLYPIFRKLKKILPFLRKKESK